MCTQYVHAHLLLDYLHHILKEVRWVDLVATSLGRFDKIFQRLPGTGGHSRPQSTTEYIRGSNHGSSRDVWDHWSWSRVQTVVIGSLLSLALLKSKK